MGNARCAAAAPELFELNDDGYVSTPMIDVPKSHEYAAQVAAGSCPERIIFIEKDES